MMGEFLYDLGWDPAWVCADCGAKYGKRPCGIATWHEDVCGVCGRKIAVTEARDFGYMNDGWQAHGSYNIDGKWENHEAE